MFDAIEIVHIFHRRNLSYKYKTKRSRSKNILILFRNKQSEETFKKLKRVTFGESRKQ